MFVDARPARQPGRPPPPVEPAHDPRAAEARLRRQVQLDDVPALVRRHRPPRARHRRRPARPAVGDGAVRPGRHRVRQGHRAQRDHQPAAHRAQARGHLRVEDPATSRASRCPTRSSATAPAPTSRPTPPPARCTSSRRRSPRSAPATPRPGRSSRSRTRRSAAGSPRPSAACSPTTWSSVAGRSRTTTRTRRRRGTAACATPSARPARTRTPCRTPRSSRRAATPTSRASTSCATVRSFDPCLPCGVHMYKGDGKPLHRMTSPSTLNVDRMASTDLDPPGLAQPDRGAARTASPPSGGPAVGHAAEELVRVLMRFYGVGPRADRRDRPGRGR